MAQDLQNGAYVMLDVLLKVGTALLYGLRCYYRLGGLKGTRVPSYRYRYQAALKAG
ncbi:hypothetical protein VMCG_02633 [Cytospora schulzeri]|uniref:Uncharacterized protein n=1 Tax=Cytospora schulzeri TaxID=448051 RepID=A0A423X1A6_9PEZI|nr:hypothetical protein VMCG_02633 [Valsa malicola]